MRLDQNTRAVAAALSRRSATERARCMTLAGKLDALSPLKVLSRGYGLVSDPKTGRPITSTAFVRPNDRIDVALNDGVIDCEVQTVRDR